MSFKEDLYDFLIIFMPAILFSIIIIIPITIFSYFGESQLSESRKIEQQRFEMCIGSGKNWIKGDCTN